MKRSLLLQLSKFNSNSLPSTLQSANSSTTPIDKIDVGIQKLCHHMFLDNYGPTTPKHNPLYLLYKGLLTQSQALEFVAGTLGSHKESRISESMRLGKAFCRWFLYTHLGMTYFAHMDDVLGKSASKQFGNVMVSRVTKGDTPDYLCANKAASVFIAEAKGRQTGALTLASFKPWRKQIKRVKVDDATGNQLKVKGYTVATRVRMDDQAAKDKSKLIAEDPETDGNVLPDGETLNAFHRIIQAHHYAAIMDQLAQPLPALALRHNFNMPEDSTVTVGVWRCLVPPLRRLLFIGGVLPPDMSDWPTYNWVWNPFTDLPWSLNLNAGRSVFFGLEKSVFSIVMEAARTSLSALANVSMPQLDIESDAEGVLSDLPPELSLLEDGTLMTSSALMRLDNLISV